MEKEECYRFDPLSFVLGKGEARSKGESEGHLEVCSLCRDEGMEVEAFLNLDLAEELLEAYRNIGLGSIETPQLFIDRFYPKTFFETILYRRDRVKAALGEKIRSLANLWPVWWPELALKARARGEMEVTGGKRFHERGREITLRYQANEDCYGIVHHYDAQGEQTLISPHQDSPDSLMRAGEIKEFSGIIEGSHEEQQGFVILVTKDRVLPPGSIVFGDKASEAAAILRVRQATRELSSDGWGQDEYPFIVVAPPIYPYLERKCQGEIRDRSDREKRACDEICYRAIVLGDREAGMIFYKITHSLVCKWVVSFDLGQVGNKIEDYVQGAYTGFFEAVDKGNFHYNSYFELLGYLKPITLRVIYDDYRKKKRQIVSALRARLRNNSLTPEQKDAMKEVVFRNGLDEPVDREILSLLLEGKQPQDMLESALIREALGNSPTKYSNKAIANRVDTTVWRTFKVLKKVLLKGGDDEKEKIGAILLDDGREARGDGL